LRISNNVWPERYDEPRPSLFKGKLTDLLARADDEAFFVMVWATFAIQSGRPERVRPLLMFPPEAATRDLASKFAVHPWKLETMLNEVLTTPKLKLLPNHPNRRLDCRKFDAIARVTNALARLENAEDGLTLERINVLREIPRITQRQFEWQRGFFSYPQFYRAGFVYGGDLTRAFFAEANGFTMHDFALAWFALRALFLDKPIVARGGGMDEIGISEKKLDAIFDLVSIPHSRARRRASELRSGPGHTAYKRSLFREYPCVAFEDAGEREHAPLPDLLTLRGTSGLFYDVIKGAITSETRFRGASKHTAWNSSGACFRPTSSRAATSTHSGRTRLIPRTCSSTTRARSR